jgi:hypothetical protein
VLRREFQSAGADLQRIVRRGELIGPSRQSRRYRREAAGCEEAPTCKHSLTLTGD